MAAVAYPEMRKHHYKPELAGACIAAGAALAVLIPPSNNFIIYGLATEQSIGRLFVGGIIPGILLCLLNILAIMWAGWRHPEWTSVSERHTWKERWDSIVKGGVIEIFLVFMISMGGMFAGFFTPTEAGAVGAFGMLVITLLTRQMNFKRFMNALYAGVRLQAMVFMLLACANVFGKLFTVSGIPVVMGNMVNGLDVPNWVVMLAILVIYFLLGMIVDLLSMTLITMPIFFPIVCGTLGYDPIWYGIILTMMISVGGNTPPVGLGVFITRGCISWDKEATVTRLFRGIWPFVVVAMFLTVVMVAFPSIVTWLPNVVYGIAK
jgi:tripartite ATP-independent transporter DctM subunit